MATHNLKVAGSRVTSSPTAYQEDPGWNNYYSYSRIIILGLSPDAEEKDEKTYKEIWEGSSGDMSL